MQIRRRFALSDRADVGVYCGENGLLVGGVPLLKRLQGDSLGWQPRPVPDLNRDLGRRYGVPVELNAKVGGLTAVAQALNRGDLLHARIATLHLQLPDPLARAQSFRDTNDVVSFARQLKASGLLKADWDPAKHPRWPAGSPGGIGGEFAPPTPATKQILRSSQRKAQQRCQFLLGFQDKFLYPPRSCRRPL
jgi:hypothetical protein